MYVQTLVCVKIGDLTSEVVDAIVNPSNSFGVMGGGVAYVIKKKGGNIIETEAVSQTPIPVGEAVKTTAGTLPARFVIHASTMKHPSENIPPRNVSKATRAALLCAHKSYLTSISFPGMGTGVGGVSPNAAAEAMLGEIKIFFTENPYSPLNTIFLVAYSDELYTAFKEWANKLLEIR